MESDTRKADFIKWLLSTYPYLNYEINAFFKYLLYNQSVLKFIEFSDHVEYAPRGIWISLQPDTEPFFKYYKDQYTYQSIEQAFHDFRLNVMRHKLTFFLEIEVSDYFLKASHLNVFQENPYVPLYMTDLKKLDQETLSISKEAFRRYLMNEIDHALDQGKFSHLDQMAHTLEKLME
ncbi:YpiB family protein [Facklamia sp. DSM 111018]|uniref:YpiB family protein n=1 Tax=Facklamia lactis TaxID=2749967 RepID=A0ABS0LMT5_9LACT|nr:YpiB family protein [Facklamia lactis]MBG9979847.1 YpiB family protein [Facklamia lactis]MBG9985473.1 YpiB family protein [Facklamia lactis]